MKRIFLHMQIILTITMKIMMIILMVQLIKRIIMISIKTSNNSILKMRKKNNALKKESLLSSPSCLMRA